MTYLSDNERQALQLARDVRDRMNQWLCHRGVKGSVIVSPFIDPAGQPNILIRTNAYIARALVLSGRRRKSFGG